VTWENPGHADIALDYSGAILLSAPSDHGMCWVRCWEVGDREDAPAEFGRSPWLELAGTGRITCTSSGRGPGTCHWHMPRAASRACTRTHLLWVERQSAVHVLWHAPLGFGGRAPAKPLQTAPYNHHYRLQARVGTHAGLGRVLWARVAMRWWSHAGDTSTSHLDCSRRCSRLTGT
jgi:hypothetical protein